MDKVNKTLDRVFEKLGTDLRAGYDRGLFKSENFDSYLMGRLKGDILHVVDSVVVSGDDDALTEVLNNARGSVAEEVEDFLDGTEPSKFDVLEASMLVETVDAEVDEEGDLVTEDIRFQVVFTVYAE